MKADLDRIGVETVKQLLKVDDGQQGLLYLRHILTMTRHSYSQYIQVLGWSSNFIHACHIHRHELLYLARITDGPRTEDGEGS